MKIETFEQLISIVPEKVKVELERLKSYRENPIYHPESSTFEHIKIVVERLLTTDDIDLIISGLYHDISKLLACEKTFEKTGKYRAFGHDKMSADMVKLDRDFIESTGANPDNVHEIVINHMRMHSLHEMTDKKVKEIESLPNFNKLKIFAKADDMLNEFKI